MPSRFRLVLWIGSLLITSGAAAPALGACRYGVRVRKEWRTLTPTEQQKFLNAVLKLQKQSTPTTPSTFDALSKLHFDLKDTWHKAPVFLPWQRKFLRDFEEKLQAAAGGPV